MSKPPRICSACGKVHALDVRCRQQIERERLRKARHDLHRLSPTERGYDSRWRRERAQFLRLFPYCRVCGQAATTVDHIIPHKGDRRLFWDRTNWQPLCTRHHSSLKQRLERAEAQQ